MTSKHGDPDLPGLFEEQRRADEASAPAFRDLLTRRPRVTRAAPASRRTILRTAMTAAVLLLVAASILLFRSRAHETEPLATASALAAWRAPTDVFLQTPGAELTSRLPALLSPAAETRLDISHE